jgi:hypothetical protein
VRGMRRLMKLSKGTIARMVASAATTRIMPEMCMPEVSIGVGF